MPLKLKDRHLSGVTIYFKAVRSFNSHGTCFGRIFIRVAAARVRLSGPRRPSTRSDSHLRPTPSLTTTQETNKILLNKNKCIPNRRKQSFFYLLNVGHFYSTPAHQATGTLQSRTQKSCRIIIIITLREVVAIIFFINVNITTRFSNFQNS